MRWLAPLEPDLPVAQVGGKAAALGRLAAAGFGIPRALVLTAAAHAQMRAVAGVTAATPERDAALAYQAADWPGSIAEAVQAASAALLTGAQGGRAASGAGAIAVRSSAVDEDGASRSLAGMFHSELHVGGTAAAREAVVRCWASAQRVPEGTQMAVIFQQMLYPSWSGVAFSADPVSRDPSQIMIEAVPGLANQLCDGQATPHRFSYDKAMLALRGQALAGGEPPDPAVLAEVARCAADTERLFGRPQDIEWARCRDGVFILQSRPITTPVGAAALSPGLTALLSEL